MDLLPQLLHLFGPVLPGSKHLAHDVVLQEDVCILSLIDILLGLPQFEPMELGKAECSLIEVISLVVLNPFEDDIDGLWCWQLCKTAGGGFNPGVFVEYSQHIPHLLPSL